MLVMLLWTLRRRWGRGPLVAAVCFGATLFPALGFVNVYPMRYSFVANHFQYLASMAAHRMVAWMIVWTICRWSENGRAVQRGVAAIVLAAHHRQVVARMRQAGANIMTLWNSTLADNPAAWMAYNNRGSVYSNTHDYVRAIQDYGKVIELKPDSREAYNNRGSAYSDTHDYARALQDYGKAIELKPDYAVTYYNRGSAYSDTHDYVRAIQDYGKAIELKPDYAEAYNNRGIAYCDTHDYVRAIQDYGKAIDLKPDYAEAYSNRGIAYGNTHDYGRAIQDYGKAIELKPDFAVAYNNRGNAYRDTHDYVRAIQDYGKVIDLKPDNAVAYHNRAVGMFRLGNHEEAWADVRMCRQLGGTPNPEFVKALTQASSRPE